ncbi:type VI secretion system tip protein TssI/VgrG [Reyranella sp.]|uniref:type VI secretion system tip protein TssI/VgrG n=1 Tax=Reyranella sp. TaxID=1929291 RepID=UPI003784C31A
MADSPQKDALIQFEMPVLEDRDKLLVTGVVGQEAISRPFVYTLSLVSKDKDIEPAQMLGKFAGFRIRRREADVIKETRGFSGFIASFSRGELLAPRREFRVYTMRLVSALSLLDQGTNYRIFQDKDVLQIIDAVLKDAQQERFSNRFTLDFSMPIQSSEKYPPLQFCVQYNETDFNFISRLMEQHGLHYFFEQTDTSHKLFIVDGPPYKNNPASPVAFIGGAKNARGAIGDGWKHNFDPQLENWVYRDREYRNIPALSEDNRETVIPEVKAAMQGEQFVYPGGYATLTTQGQTANYVKGLVRTRMEEEETRYDTFTGSSFNVPFAAGTRIKIITVAEQPAKERIPNELEKEYLLTSVSFTATEASFTQETTAEILLRVLKSAAEAGGEAGLGALTQSAKANLPDVNKTINELPRLGSLIGSFFGGFAGVAVAAAAEILKPHLSDIPIIGIFFKKAKPPPAYNNTFTAVPIINGRQYRSPSITKKPRVPGPQTATVFGATDEDVATDELGRVKVKFDWDRTGTGGPRKPVTNSCFIRVAQPWAGPKWGMQFLPRVGEEVLVDFIDGDPDRPLITGRVFNAAHNYPLDLPKFRLRSGIKTRTVPLATNDKAKFHMMRFDDTAGKEQLLLRSQGRTDVTSFGTYYETVHSTLHSLIGGKDPETGKSGGSLIVTVGGEHDQHIMQDQYEGIDSKFQLTVKADVAHDLQAKYETVVGTKATLNAQEVVVEASQKITLKVGASFVVVSPAGVHINGAMVNINSGGSPGSTVSLTMTDPLDAARADPGDPQDFIEKHPPWKGGGARRTHTANAHHGLTVTANKDGTLQVGRGIKVGGDQKYQDTVVSQLAQINDTKMGNALITDYQATDKTMTIQPANPPFSPPNAEESPANWDNSENGKGTDSTVKYNPDQWPNPTNAPDVPGDAILFHEMTHSKHGAHGTQDHTARTDGFDNQEEFNTIQDENKYRDERGVRRRTDHQTF